MMNDPQPIAMAVGVVFNRIHSLSKTDRSDMVELVRGLADAGDEEEVESVRLAMLELLENAPVRTRPMTMPPSEDESFDSEAGKLARHVGKTVRGLREKAGMSQTVLAEKSGLTQSHVSRIETGVHCPNHLTMRKLAETLGVAVRVLDPCDD